MGFFSKFFGTSKEDTGSGTAASTGIFRTVRHGGYDKRAVLGAVDAINSEILALTEAYEKKKNGEPYTLPQSAEFELTKVSSGGFSEDDIDAYIAEMKKTISELRALF